MKIGDDEVPVDLSLPDLVGFISVGEFRLGEALGIWVRWCWFRHEVLGSSGRSDVHLSLSVLTKRGQRDSAQMGEELVLFDVVDREKSMRERERTNRVKW